MGVVENYIVIRYNLMASKLSPSHSCHLHCLTALYSNHALGVLVTTLHMLEEGSGIVQEQA